MSRERAYFMKTARLGFGRWSIDDSTLAAALWGDPELTRFIGGPFSREAVEERLHLEIAQLNSHNVQYWPLFILRSGEHAGCGGLRPHRSDDGIYELGIHLRPAFWGQGLGEEAGRGIIAFAFETLGANGLFAGHHPANAASRKLIQKLGFQYTHEELYPPTGLQHPSYLLMPSPRTERKK
jgi:[ribosomal protein S5]-alanine N-acetyltransferase